MQETVNSWDLQPLSLRGNTRAKEGASPAETTFCTTAFLSSPQPRTSPFRTAPFTRRGKSSREKQEGTGQTGALCGVLGAAGGREAGSRFGAAPRGGRCREPRGAAGARSSLCAVAPLRSCCLAVLRSPVRGRASVLARRAARAWRAFTSCQRSRLSECPAPTWGPGFHRPATPLAEAPERPCSLLRGVWF